MARYTGNDCIAHMRPIYRHMWLSQTLPFLGARVHKLLDLHYPLVRLGGSLFQFVFPICSVCISQLFGSRLPTVRFVITNVSVCASRLLCVCISRLSGECFPVTWLLFPGCLVCLPRFSAGCFPFVRFVLPGCCVRISRCSGLCFPVIWFVFPGFPVCVSRLFGSCFPVVWFPLPGFLLRVSRFFGLCFRLPCSHIPVSRFVFPFAWLLFPDCLVCLSRPTTEAREYTLKTSRTFIGSESCSALR